MSPNDPRHGSEAGHEQHLRDGEPSCQACTEADLRAGRRRSKRKVMGYQYQKPLGHLVDKLAVLRDAGATHDDIASWAGISASQAWRCCHASADDLVYTRTWNRLERMRPGPIITPTGIQRRLRALVWLGYSFPVIAAEAECSRDTIADAAKGVRCFLKRDVRDRIVATYDRLSMHPAAPTDRYGRVSASKARRYARERGWLPPLALDDERIDDPTYKPSRTHVARSPRHYRGDLLAEWQHLRASGVSIHQAARQLGVTVGAIEKAVERARGAA